MIKITLAIKTVIGFEENINIECPPSFNDFPFDVKMQHLAAMKYFVDKTTATTYNKDHLVYWKLYV